MALFGRKRPNIERLQRRGDVAKLRAAAAYREVGGQADQPIDLGAAVRVAALDALAGFEPGEWVETARTALSDSDAAVRTAAVALAVHPESGVEDHELVEALVAWGDPADEQPRAALHSALTHREDRTGIGSAFAAALAGHGDLDRERDERTLRELLPGDDAGRRLEESAIARDLGRRIEEPALNEPERNRAGAILLWLGESAGPVLASLVRAPQPPLLAIALAGRLGDTALLPDLALLCQHHDTETRAAAARAIGTVQDTRGVAALLRLTQDSALGVRRAAVEALDDFGVDRVLFGVSGGAGSAAIAAAVAPEIAQVGVAAPGGGEDPRG